MVKQPKKTPFSDKESRSKDLVSLVLFNDDINTFDYVIKKLVEVCQHDAIQAEQCAYITHFKGKCSVATGTFDRIATLHASLSESGLTVEVQK